MAFVCPQCGDYYSLEIGDILEVPPDSRSDDIVIQLVGCPWCGFTGVAVYEESRRGALDSESIDHYGYALEKDHFLRLKRLMTACLNPGRPDCQCSIHLQLGRQNAQGRWAGLEGFPLGRYFTMILD